MTKGDYGVPTDGDGGIFGEGGDLFSGGTAFDAHYATVAENGIFIVIFGEHGHEWIEGGFFADFSEAHGGEEADSVVLVFEEGDDFWGSIGDFSVTEDFGRLSSNLGIGICEECGDGSEGVGMFCAELTETPDGVESGERVWGSGICGDLGESLD